MQPGDRTFLPPSLVDVPTTCDKLRPRNITSKSTTIQAPHHNLRARASSLGPSTLTTSPDPYQITARFVPMHRRHIKSALSEIKAGMKRSCWSWCLLPTGPYVVNGRERGSGMNAHYALRGTSKSGRT
eukprot:PhM_4_TR7117/c0_g1_i1/m.70422